MCDCHASRKHLKLRDGIAKGSKGKCLESGYAANEPALLGSLGDGPGGQAIILNCLKRRALSAVTVERSSGGGGQSALPVQYGGF